MNELNSDLKIAILKGSASDLDTMMAAKAILDDFGVEVEMRILSAHRTPEEACLFAAQAQQRGVKVIIAAAGLAAHLAGVVAAHSMLPVIGVPIDGGPLKGVDALLSTVQMPRGTPVATVAIGKTGAANAALLALRILALNNEALGIKLAEYKERHKTEVLQADAQLQQQLKAKNK